MRDVRTGRFVTAGWPALALLFPLVCPPAALAAPGDELPDFGTPADQALSRDREEQIGRGALLQLRNAGAIVEDPELTEYIGTLGSQLASHANNGDFRFNFFVVKDDEVNAFALPGGFVGVNTGLILATDNENELAAVLAHEVSHVTQRHMARAMYDNQKTSVVSMAAMLAALVLGAASHMPSDAMAGIVTGSQALAAQRQLNFTRANEAEADRVGMQVLASTGFDPNGMASFFDKLEKRYGTTLPGLPEMLQTHPVTSDRIAEARSRARQLPSVRHADSIGYQLAKARLQVLEAPTPEAAMALFKPKIGSRAPADRYGLAMASMRISLNDQAEQLFRDLATEYPTVIAYRIGQAEALMASGSKQAALTVYAEATRLFPRNIPLTISYAESLITAGEPAEANKLLLDLLNNVEGTPEQFRLIARAANAQGDVGNAYYDMSYYYTSIGNLRQAIGQMRLALESPNVQPVDHAKFKARLKELMDYLPEDRRDERDEDGERRPEPRGS
jgi:predicted Zn-dependent protease